jgi:hypothetical protein
LKLTLFFKLYIFREQNTIRINMLVSANYDEDYWRRYRDNNQVNGVNPFGNYGVQLQGNGAGSGWGAPYGVSSEHTSIFDVEPPTSNNQPYVFGASAGAATVSDGVKTDPMSMGGSLFNISGVTDNPNITGPMMSVPGAGNTIVGLAPSGGSENPGGSGNPTQQGSSGQRFGSAQLFAMTGGGLTPTRSGGTSTLPNGFEGAGSPDKPVTTGEGTFSVGDNGETPEAKGDGNDNGVAPSGDGVSGGNGVDNPDKPEKPDNPDNNGGDANGDNKGDSANNDTNSLNKQEQKQLEEAQTKKREDEERERNQTPQVA